MRAKTRKIIAIALALILKRNKRTTKPRKRRVWVKEIHKKIEKDTFDKQDEQQEMSLYDFRNFLIKDSACYEELLQKVSPFIEKRDTNMRDAIPPHQRLSVTLSYLATGTKFEEMKSLTAISAQAISKIVMETCEAIIKTLDDYIKVPTQKSDWENIAESFGEIWNFPNCVGVVGGTHIAIKSPPASGSFYFNYKRFPSVVLTAVVNANYEFIFADIAANGLDGEVFDNSSLGKALKQGTLRLPKPSKTLSTNNRSYVLAGDGAFQLTENILTPYRTCLLPQERIFNYRLRRAQQVVENVFGIIVARFGVLQHTIGLAPEKVKIVVLACCYLHNFLQKKCQRSYISHELVDNEDTTCGAMITGLWRDAVELIKLEPSQENMNSSINAKKTRDSIALYFSNEGQVPWQEKFVQIKD